MKATKKQIQTRVLKKVSALRATLTNEERAFLDSLIVVDEVKGHKAVVNKAATKAAGKNVPRLQEVEAHKMAGRSTTKAQAKIAPRITFDPNTEEYKITE